MWEKVRKKKKKKKKEKKKEKKKKRKKKKKKNKKKKKRKKKEKKKENVGIFSLNLSFFSIGKNVIKKIFSSNRDSSSMKQKI